MTSRRIRMGVIAIFSAIAVMLLTSPSAHATAYNVYTTNNRCGTFAFESRGEKLLLVDNCADGLGVIGYYSRAESTKSRTIKLTAGNGSSQWWDKSWPEGRLIKIMVCAYYKDGNHKFCSKYKYARA